MKQPEEASKWRNDMAPFEKSDNRKGIWQLINTVLPFLALWTLAYLSLSVSYWLAIPFDIVAAGFLIRIFILFHDCCHMSFFKSKLANEITGICMGLLTAFPYTQWKHEHAVHHATSSNLSRRGTGDIWTLTVDEYIALAPLQKLGYRLYRNPIVMFGFGPIYILLVAYRYNKKGASKKERINTHGTTLGLLVLAALLYFTLGWKAIVLVEGPILYLSAMVGIWLFYVQHQFEHTYFEEAEEWDYVSAALQGSSFYKLPRVLQWMVGNIGFHHIHHLSPRVPNYMLQQVHESNDSLKRVTSISLLGSVKSLKYRVWDEKTKRFLGFRDLSNL